MARASKARASKRTAERALRFPPAPPGLTGRSVELGTLRRTIEAAAPTRVALVGTGGSGKSVLAAALGHEMSAYFGGRLDWFRVGAWDFYTLTEMLALRFGTPRGDERVDVLRSYFAAGERRLVVLDNHEDDRAMARLLDAFSGTPVTFVITARRCLLAGVFVFPVTAPLVMSGQSAFPRVASLTELLRWSPLALDMANAIVSARAATVTELERYLRDGGVTRVVAIEHEDDLPEVALLVSWVFQRLDAPSRRMLAVLAYSEGDHVDAASLAMLGGVRRGANARIAELVRFRLVQEPARGRFALHAVVRHIVRKLTEFPAERFFEHYVRLLERHPERLQLEQTHLFAAMDHAHRESDLGAMLRVQALLRHLDGEVG